MAPAYYSSFERTDYPERTLPLLSQPLVELCLRIPTYVLIRSGRDRALARRAFANDLPAEIIARYAKGRADHHSRNILDANLAFVRELLLDGALVQKGLLNRTNLELYLTRTDRLPIFSTTRSSRSTSAPRRGCEPGLPALPQLQAEEAPVGVGVLLIVTYATIWLLRKGGSTLKTLRASSSIRVPATTSWKSREYRSGVAGRSWSRNRSGAVVCSRYRGSRWRSSPHLRTEPGEFPTGGGAHAQVDRLVLGAEQGSERGVGGLRLPEVQQPGAVDTQPELAER